MVFLPPYSSDFICMLKVHASDAIVSNDNSFLDFCSCYSACSLQATHLLGAPCSYGHDIRFGLRHFLPVFFIRFVDFVPQS